MYEIQYIVKTFKFKFDKKGNKKIYQSSKEVIKDQKQAYKRAWLLSEEAWFTTIDEIKSATSRILTIGKYER